MEGVPFPASPSQFIPTVKNAGNWSFPPTLCPSCAKVGDQAGTANPVSLDEFSPSIWTVWGLDTTWGVKSGNRVPKHA